MIIQATVRHGARTNASPRVHTFLIISGQRTVLVGSVSLFQIQSFSNLIAMNTFIDNDTNRTNENVGDFVEVNRDPNSSGQWSISFPSTNYS